MSSMSIGRFLFLTVVQHPVRISLHRKRVTIEVTQAIRYATMRAEAEVYPP
jgi:hypothetical protein